MTDAEGRDAEQPEQTSPGKVLVRQNEWAPGGGGDDAGSAAGWARQRWVLLSGLALIVADLAWRAQFVSHLYFRQDDFENLDLAVKSRLNWHYLSYIGDGHFMMGQRLIAWLLTRISLYDWPLAATVSVAFFGCAAVAALRLLRTLFGEHPAILVPLALFLLSPLTLPSSGYWTSATEELPLVLAIFMAVGAHVRYVRSGRMSHLVAAVGWVAFGLFFCEKGLALPFLLFVVTSAGFAGQRSWLAGARRALVRFRTAWLSYAAVLAAYSVLFGWSLRTTTVLPQTPHSAAAVLTFSWRLLKDNLVTGLVGGPWQWLPISDGTYAIAAPPSGLTWLAVIIAVAVISASVLRRKVAWRYWVIWIGWVAAADMLPVIVRENNKYFPVLYALETRFVVDGVAVLVICLGLAFLPLVPEQRAAVPAIRWNARRSERELAWRRVAAGVLAVFVLGSILTTHSYASDVSGNAVARYIANAKQALKLAPRGTLTVDAPVPANVEVGTAHPALASTVIGDLRPGQLRWILAPGGTVDNLRIFGPDGRLYLAQVQGASSPAGNPCWPEHHQQIVIRFWKYSPWYSAFLRIGYLWRGAVPGIVDVQYGSAVLSLTVLPGAHGGYLHVSGSANFVVIDGVSGGMLCVGDAEAGSLAPDLAAPAIPAAPGAPLASR